MKQENNRQKGGVLTPVLTPVQRGANAGATGANGCGVYVLTPYTYRALARTHPPLAPSWPNTITIATNVGEETISVTAAEAKEYQRDPYDFGARYFGFRNRKEYGMWIGKVKPGRGVGFIAIGKLGDP
jgi:hypothetical protein